MSECPCDSCRFNFLSGEKCPNIKFFFEAYMLKTDGKVKTDICEKWEAKE